jgi:hypothetical protein
MGNMKYLYLMCRLFKCPHKYHIVETMNCTLDGRPDGAMFVSRCSRCGKIVKKKV